MLSDKTCMSLCFFFSSRRRHTRFKCDWSSDVCSSDLVRSVDKDHGYSDAKTYNLGNLCYNVGGSGGCNALTDASATPEPQKYHRRVFSSTAVLRNIAFRAVLKP